ncbi:ABC transporter substrate-binding protein [Cetobacterium sp. 8H]|uniref:ABC transporter substrate-binding protein n=1 Tax=Cetobacterium sp. 8H TaxID=2759681 RepID=UPI00163B9CE7|nr:ABC transporter substrate-binding protein [Cetobacterium sp. 8H]MBC2851128.1 ABC transporter substrate-binding protein [Cetobacterium sp. 8H]
MKYVIVFLVIIANTFALEIKGNMILGEKNEVIPLKEYKRIVVYNFGAVELLYKIGAGEKIVGVANHNKKIWPEEKTKLIPLAGGVSKPSIEKILSFNPDLVIFNIMGNQSEELKKFGIPSITFVNRSLNDILKNTLVLGKITNKEKESLDLVEELTNKLNLIKNGEKIEGKALILYSDSPPTSFAKDSLPVEILEQIGLEVILPKGGKKSIVSSEYILRENPKYIIGTRGINKREEIIKSIPLIEETDAFKDGNIYLIDSTEIMRASHRVFDEIENIYKILKGDSNERS